MQEIWKDIYYVDSISGEIVDYRGYYQVSNLGRVKSLSRKIYFGYNNETLKITKEKILKLKMKSNGYLYVGLHKDGKEKCFHIHRLVAHMFIDNHNCLPQVNHKDENKQNNNIDNLEWCTNEYNQKYGTKNKRAGKTHKEKYSGDNHWNTGRKWNDESRKKLSNSRKEKYKGKNNSNAKRVNQYNLDGKLIKTWYCVKDISDELELSYSMLKKTLQGKRKTYEYKGFIWKYDN